MTPSYPSFYLPPEWTSQSGVMLTWPHIDTIWADTLSAIDEVFTEVAAHISKRERVLMVGDTPETDILGGINAGLETCWLNTSKQISTIKPHYEVASLHELHDLLM